uniref:Phosphoprotein phosphatase n=1 Tax=Solanum tuberosum TaxID=4113 RepID=M1BMQ6_SOLTU
MSPSVAKGLLNLRELDIGNCQSMEEVITEGEGVMTLFPLLEKLNLTELPKLGHFFLTENALKFPFLKKVEIYDCPKMKTFVQHGISVSLESDDEVNVMFNSKVFCPNLEKLHISMAQSIMARGLLNLRSLEIKDCHSMEKVIREEEQQGEGIMTLFPLLEELKLQTLPKLGHFFLTENALKFSNMEYL